MDALNSISIKDKYTLEGLSLFKPREHMIISKNDGMFDDSFNLIKEQVVALYQLCHLSDDGKPRVVRKPLDKEVTFIKIKRTKKEEVPKIPTIKFKKIR